MSFRPPVGLEQNIDQFTGRTWLLPKILEWYEKSSERLLLLTGAPGTGKSMILAWLAGFGPVPDDSTAREQLAQIRAQVKATHFCIAASGETAPRALAKNLAVMPNDRTSVPCDSGSEGAQSWGRTRIGC